MKIKFSLAAVSLLATLANIPLAHAQGVIEKPVIPPPSGIQEEMLVTGGRHALRTLPGSAYLVDEEEIAKYETTDINTLLSQVPGVYIREEDGFGLRPNIGLRGTSTERSSKVSIMEDGILIGPAPYSAPAAYYVPNVGRMSAVEVFKGPAAIQHGPHSVGGAINFVTRHIPTETTGEIAVTGGSYGFEKYRLFYGDSFDGGGFWLDAFRYGSDGFKEADNGDDTGFIRNDFNTKIQFNSDDSAPVYQELIIKAGYADEDADETYLGLTDEDFEANSLRRYRASALDRFQSEHTQLQLLHSADFRNHRKIITRVYHHEFSRAWNKFDGIIEGPAIRDVLANPDIFRDEMQLLRGEIDSNPLSTQRIDITNNDREFGVSGIDSRVQYGIQFAELKHNLELGVRLHNDWVERQHSQRGYLMQSGDLVFDGNESRPDKALNRGESDALAVYLLDEIVYGSWLFNVGIRMEQIDSDYHDYLTDTHHHDTQQVALPGAGVVYKINPAFSLLLGVNKGFSAKAASAAPEIEPEESVNYEYGLRFSTTSSRIDVIGFYSDYANLLGRCRASDPCAGEEFNGGEINVGGAELIAEHAFALKPGWSLPASLSYTWTTAEFGSSFESSFDQWGDFVTEGDELPYLPEHQLRLEAGLESIHWSFFTAIKYISEMREIAGRGAYDEDEYTPELTTFDMTLARNWNDHLSARLVAENITNEQEVVSRRPYGARPNQPRTIKLGVQYKF